MIPPLIYVGPLALVEVRRSELGCLADTFHDRVCVSSRYRRRILCAALGYTSSAAIRRFSRCDRRANGQCRNLNILVDDPMTDSQTPKPTSWNGSSFARSFVSAVPLIQRTAAG